MMTSHHSLHSALGEFFDPLRTNDSRADFYVVYRRESGEFDQDYARKYDEDLNTSLIFVSRPFSARSIERLTWGHAGRSVLCNRHSTHRNWPTKT